MAKTTAELLDDGSTTPSFTTELISGRFRWDLMSPWPTQDPADQSAGDAVVARMREFLAERVDPSEVDTAGRLPDGLVDDLKKHGYLRLAVTTEHGGQGLSPYNVFRVVEAAAGWTLPVAMTVAIEAAIGVGAYLPVLPDGQLRDLIRSRVRDGVVSGTADTEPTGAANQTRRTTATPSPDGRSYLLNGEKVHIGNAPVAELLWATATVRDGGRDRIRTFLVDTRSPGVEIMPSHRFMGLRGFPNGPVRFTDVVVPVEHMFVEETEYEGRLTPSLAVLLSVGRLFLICAPSLAIGRACVEAAREFAGRRAIDGRRLGEYDEIQRQVAMSLADVFAIESIAEWSLLAGAVAGVNPLLEQNLAKNIASLACWRTVERTMSLLASEAFETAESKAARGVPPTPMERLFRDARGLRISGGVDFQLDNWFSQMIVFAEHAAPGPAASAKTGVADPAEPKPGNLVERNIGHLRAVAADVPRFANTCQRLAAGHPDPAELALKEHLHVALGAICGELVAMSATLARASRRAGEGDETAQDLADIFCVEARNRVDGWWRRLSQDGGPGYAAVSDGWLYGDRAR
jgi:alkylation response protein AidB-like acyl-CoA dehydrogenase